MLLLLDKGAFGVARENVFERDYYSGEGINFCSKRPEAVLTIKSRKGRDSFFNRPSLGLVTDKFEEKEKSK